MNESTPLSTYEPGNTAINVWLIRDPTSAGGPSSIAGIASGKPGTPVLQGVTRQVVGEVIAHEMGHELGMFHTTEFAGNPAHDPVPDTLRCLASPVNPANCAGTGDQYVLAYRRREPYQLHVYGRRA